MRHQRQDNRLSLTKGHRKALIRNMVRSLMMHRRIVTTLARAKQARYLADHIITLAKRKSLHATRQISSALGSRDLAKMIVTTFAPHFEKRNGGYTRILHLGNRRGDNAQTALLELVGAVELAPGDAKEKKKKTKEKPKALPRKAEAEAREKERAGPKEKLRGKPERGEPSEMKKEEPKKGGFLSTLRKFLKGDDT